ncbi:hypothetical protein VTO73DRAFT_9009 [Trametes versicolor]
MPEATPVRINLPHRPWKGLPFGSTEEPHDIPQKEPPPSRPKPDPVSISDLVKNLSSDYQCVQKCMKTALKTDICVNLVGDACLCTKTTAYTSAQMCVTGECGSAKAQTLLDLRFAQKCASSLPSLSSLLYGTSQTSSMSASVSIPSDQANPCTCPSIASASPTATATGSATCGSQQDTTVATPVTTLAISPPTPDVRGSISTAMDGVQFAHTVTDSDGAEATSALSSPLNNAGYMERTSFLVAALAVMVVAWSI